MHSINEVKINNAFEQVLVDVDISEKIAKQVSSILEVRFDSFTKNQANKVNALKESLQKIGKREDRLYDNYYADIIDQDVYKPN